MQTKVKEDKWTFKVDVLSRSISSFGDLIFYPVMLAIAATMENPAQAMLLVSLSESIPIFLSVIIGVLSDRINNVFKSMHLLNILRFILYFVSGLFFFKNITFAFYLTIIINFVSDCIGKAYNPLANVLLVTYADETTMVEKQGLLNSIQGVVQIFAPLLGTVLLATLSFGVIGIINSLTFLATTAALLLAKKQFQKASHQVAIERKHLKQQTDTWGQIKKSFNFIFKDKAIVLIVFVCLIVNMFTLPLVRIVLPMFLLNNHIAAAEGMATQLVFLNVTFAVGSIIGSLISRYFKHFPMFRIFTVCLSLMAVFIGAMAFFKQLLILNILFFIIGIVGGVINTLFMGYLMQIVTQDIMGGVTNAVMLISAGGGIVGDLAATGLLNVVSSTTLVQIIGGALLFIGVVMTLFTWRRKEKIITVE